jgi:hypothetical protein
MEGELYCSNPTLASLLSVSLLSSSTILVITIMIVWLFACLNLRTNRRSHKEKMIEASQRERSIEGRKIKRMMKRNVGVMDYQNNFCS